MLPQCGIQCHDYWYSQRTPKEGTKAMQSGFIDTSQERKELHKGVYKYSPPWPHKVLCRIHCCHMTRCCPRNKASVSMMGAQSLLETMGVEFKVVCLEGYNRWIMGWFCSQERWLCCKLIWKMSWHNWPRLMSPIPQGSSPPWKYLHTTADFDEVSSKLKVYQCE